MVFRTRITLFLRFLLSTALLAAGRPDLARCRNAAKRAAVPAVPQQATTVGQTPAAGESAAEKKKPKKVWTNDELQSVKGGVSVVGTPEKHKKQSNYTLGEADSAGLDVHQQQVQNYRNQIQQFREQIDAADKRIAQLKDFRAEDSSSSGGINLGKRYNMVPLEEQEKQLESRKKQLQAKIEALENEARKNGIEPGELR
jgi:chromosome segregation ATPase